MNLPVRIVWDTPNLEDLAATGDVSPVYDIFDVPWRLSLFRLEPASFSLFLMAFQLTDDLPVSFTLKTLDGQETAEQHLQFTFSPSHSNCGVTEFLPVERIGKFAAAGRLKVELTIECLPAIQSTPVYRGLLHHDGPAFLNPLLLMLFHFPAFRRSLTDPRLRTIFHRMQFSANVPEISELMQMDLQTFLDFVLCRRLFEIELVGEKIMYLSSDSCSHFVRLPPVLLIHCDSPMQVKADLILTEVSGCRVRYQLNAAVLQNSCCCLRRKGKWIEIDDTSIRRVSVLNGNVWFLLYLRADQIDRLTEPMIIEEQSEQSDFISIQLFTGFRLPEGVCSRRAINVSVESTFEENLVAVSVAVGVDRFSLWELDGFPIRILPLSCHVADFRRVFVSDEVENGTLPLFLTFFKPGAGFSECSFHVLEAGANLVSLERAIRNEMEIDNATPLLAFHFNQKATRVHVNKPITFESGAVIFQLLRAEVTAVRPRSIDLLPEFRVHPTAAQFLDFVRAAVTVTASPMRNEAETLSVEVAGNSRVSDLVRCLRALLEVQKLTIWCS
jgi:hypothetical protein